jgi:hypothetical protein
MPLFKVTYSKSQAHGLLNNCAMYGVSYSGSRLLILIAYCIVLENRYPMLNTAGYVDSLNS